MDGEGKLMGPESICCGMLITLVKSTIVLNGPPSIGQASIREALPLDPVRSIDSRAYRAETTNAYSMRSIARPEAQHRDRQLITFV
jgi:hypothetical protein